MSSSDDPLSRLDAEQQHAPAFRLAFSHQLDALDAELVAVATVVADLIVPVTQGFLDADAPAAQQAITQDVEVDRRCETLEEECFALLARESPVAGDLRRV